MLNIEIKEDSAEKLAAVQGKPTKNYLFAQELNEIVAAVNALDSSINPDRIISLGTETVDGNEYTYEGYTWQLNGASISNSEPITIVIPSATTGFRRKDISVFKSDGTIERVPGTETDGEVVTAPDVPEGTLFYKYYDINGDAILVDPEPTIIDGSVFKKKSEELGYGDPNLTGANAVIKLRPEGYSRYAFSHAGLVSIDGFGLDLITGNPDAEAPYPGKDLFIENTGATPFSLLHQGAGDADSKFFFLDETDLVIPAGGKVWLKYGVSDCEVIFKSWSDGGKRTQIIQFAWAGGNYSASSAWWRINNGSSNSKYNFAFTQTPVVVPTNAFSDDITNPFHEMLMFDGIVKEVIVVGNNNGASWNCDLAIRGYDLGATYNPGTGAGITNSQIVARETIVIGAGGSLTVNKFLPSSISTDVLTKYTALRAYFKSEGVANSNWQNALITILIEEA